MKPMRHFIASITSSSYFCEKKSWKSSWGQFEEKLDLGRVEVCLWFYHASMHWMDTWGSVQWRRDSHWTHERFRKKIV